MKKKSIEQKKTNKVCFEVIYSPGSLRPINKIISSVDLGVGRLLLPIKEEWSWETTTELDTKYVEKMKKAIKLAVEKLGNDFISATFKL